MLGHTLKSKHALGTLYILNFLLGAHIALIVYFNASFLESRGISESFLGPIFMVGSALSIAVYYTLPRLLNTLGVYRLLMITSLMEMLLFFGLGFSANTVFILILFITSLAISVALFYGLDILLEAQMNTEDDTGNGRSSFLTVLNIAYVISPFLAGLILKYFGFNILYSISALLLLPFMYLLKKEFSTFRNTHYRKFTIRPILTKIKTNSDIRNIYIIQFLIRFFFSWMVIYTPIYLQQTIGFSISAIGIMFSVMLLPFALLEWPLGHYADKRYGEKEFLILGFAIMALATYYISFITTADFALWMLALFITRIGAAIIEVMNEIYFFKHVDSTDTDSISAFRMLSPLAYIIGPAIGSLIIILLPMQYMFGILGIIMLIGIIASMQLKDTR